MKHLLFASAAVLGLSAHAEAETLFRGPLEVTAVNAACAGIKDVGNQDNAQFHPRGLGNDNFMALTTIYDFGGSSYSLNNGSFGTAYKKVDTGGLGWSKYDANAQASVLLNPVPVITSGTNALTLIGKIKNPNGNSNEANCEVSFRAVMYKRVE
jgi:hypothetical protein